MKKEKSAVKTLLTLGKVLLTTSLILILIVILVQRFSRNDLSIGGFRVFSIVSESMSPDYEIGDILISKDVEISEINVGDDLTYKGTDGDMAGLVITHRVIEVFEEENGKFHFLTKGISNELADPEITEDQVYGKVIYRTVLFSFLGRLMSNMVIYYMAFVIIGVSVSYQIVAGFIRKDDKDEEEQSESIEEVPVEEEKSVGEVKEEIEVLEFEAEEFELEEFKLEDNNVVTEDSKDEVNESMEFDKEGD